MKKRALFTFTESLLFIIGAVFLAFSIVNGANVWFYVGLAFALIAFAIWVTSLIVEKRTHPADVAKTNQTAS
ncbi:MAG: hypothetical protein LBQ05_03340 [Christensenellaceae bacterium]|jgi:hypothetical protein|nr:hypothetical protein [Christensenellaceae bacterium]